MIALRTDGTGDKGRQLTPLRSLSQQKGGIYPSGSAEIAGAVGSERARKRDDRIALIAAGCLIACALLWVAALHWWWPL